MPVQCALAGASPTVVRPLISHGVGRVTLRPPVPTHSEGDGLASDLTDAQSLSGGDSERFTATRPPAQSSCHGLQHGSSGSPIMGGLGHSNRRTEPPSGIGTCPAARAATARRPIRCRYSWAPSG